MTAAVLLIFVVFPSGTIAEESPQAAVHSGDKDLEVGFLELLGHPPVESATSEDTRRTYRFRVRLAFKWQDGKWIPFKHDFRTSESLHKAHTLFSGQRSWTAVIHGREIARLSSAGVQRYNWYADVGIQEILGDVDYRVFEEEMIQVPCWSPLLTRLLVLTSGSSWGDPEGWRRETDTKLVPPGIVNVMKHNVRLRKPGPEDTIWTAPEVPYSREELEVVEVYRCGDGRGVIGVQFREGSRAYREDHAADLSVHWMAFEGAKEPRYLGSEMIVLDIEDFDGDGKSEFVFWLNAYNRNGYVIVWDNFRQRSSFIWSYH